MSSVPHWKSQLSFSDRVTALTRIATAMKRADLDLDPSKVQQLARTAETEAYERAESPEEYRRRCDTAVVVYSDRSSNPDDPYVEAVPEGGSTLGEYHHALHHQDGLFSTVYKAWTSADRVVAVKVTTPDAMSPPHDSKREVRILASSASSHVIPLLDHYPLGSRFCLVFPYMPDDLQELLRRERLSVAEVRSHLRDVFRALEHIHAIGVIHRDIKPSNILLRSPSGPAYLADFGIAWSPMDPASEDSQAKCTDVGTTCYRPPELLFGKTTYGCSLDLWAAGCVVAEAVTLKNHSLFDAGPLGSELALIQSIFKKIGTPTLGTWPEAARLPDWGKMEFYRFPPKPWIDLLPDVPEAALDLVDQLVRFESGARLTAEQALSHPFLIDPEPPLLSDTSRTPQRNHRP